MKKMILFVLLWQGYATASDGELRQLLAPHSSTSMSINQKEIEVPLVDLGGDLSTSPSGALRTAWEQQKESLEQSSSTGDCKRVATLLVIPGLCAGGGAAAAAVLLKANFYWMCSGALSGTVIGNISIPVVANCYDMYVDQPDRPLEMREED